MKKQKILILDDERKGIQHLEDALSTAHDVTWCRNIKDGMRLLSERPDYDIVICGTHLLHESMFDFLRQVRKIAANNSIPFVCFRAGGTDFTSAVDDGIKTATELLGANGYIVIDDVSDSTSLRERVEAQLQAFIPAR